MVLTKNKWSLASYQGKQDLSDQDLRVMEAREVFTKELRSSTSDWNPHGSRSQIWTLVSIKEEPLQTPPCYCEFLKSYTSGIRAN
jgi:hypothetical protein